MNSDTGPAHFNVLSYHNAVMETTFKDWIKDKINKAIQAHEYHEILNYHTWNQEKKDQKIKKNSTAMDIFNRAIVMVREELEELKFCCSKRNDFTLEVIFYKYYTEKQKKTIMEDDCYICQEKMRINEINTSICCQKHFTHHHCYESYCNAKKKTGADFVDYYKCGICKKGLGNSDIDSETE